MTTVKQKLQTTYPTYNWSHLDGGDGDLPVFYKIGNTYYTYDDMWPSGLNKMSSSQIVTFLAS